MDPIEAGNGYIVSCFSLLCGGIVPPLLLASRVFSFPLVNCFTVLFSMNVYSFMSCSVSRKIQIESILCPYTFSFPLPSY